MLYRLAFAYALALTRIECLFCPGQLCKMAEIGALGALSKTCPGRKRQSIRDRKKFTLISLFYLVVVLRGEGSEE